MIEEINKALYENPALFHASDEEKGTFVYAMNFTYSNNSILGWLCKVRLQDPSEVSFMISGLCCNADPFIIS